MKSNDLGKRFLVEECQRIEISYFLKQSKEKLKESLMHSKIDASGIALELMTSGMHFGGVRYWFKCPLCSKKMGTLFIHPLNQQVACRGCLGLEYRKIRYKGMIEESLG
ncbi:MAG: hypothetical protein EXS48_01670 [Candidatus Staskawiczbacteria bacterium]|nr:hypothetical protein [Candidatus Staskawiczbacteria bacterium]